MRTDRAVKYFLKVSIFLLCIVGLGMTGTEVKAEEEIQIVREATGDLEQLEAIQIPDEVIEEWEKAESSQEALNRASSAANQFLEYGSEYGYQDMAKRSHAAGRQYAYQQIEKLSRSFTVNGADAAENNSYGSFMAGTIDLSGYGLTGNEIVEIYFTFRNDNPQFFWLSNHMIYGTNKLVVLTYDEYANGAVRLAALEEITGTAQSVYQSHVSSSDSSYQKVLKIHDALIADIEYSYDTSIPTAHSIAGAMTSARSAVCEGYAKVMQVMMNSYGITNIYVTGDAGGGHAWNMVRMNDGKYYWLDATWDDQEQEVFWHDYFLVGNKNFTDHTPDLPTGTGTEFLYELPQVSDDDYVYDPSKPNIRIGDVNEDGDVNLVDLMMCLNHVAKKGQLGGNAFLAADVNEDGDVNLIDLMRILNYVSKKSTTL